MLSDLLRYEVFCGLQVCLLCRCSSFKMTFYRQRWGAWKEVKSLQGLKEGLKVNNATEPKPNDLRSICWKVYIMTLWRTEY